MKRALLALTGLFLASAAAAQAPSPAQLGITPATNPEDLQVLDSTKTWVPLGAVNPDTHTFTPVGGGGGSGSGIGEADILVTDITVGMAAATAVSVPDNAPHISALMNKIIPASVWTKFTAGYDVTFPSVPGQTFTEYYFSQPLILSRGANYHCSGPLSGSTILYFAPGVDGVIQENSKNTDGGNGQGRVDGCGIRSLGFGSATANAIWNPNGLTNAGFLGDSMAWMPKPIWYAGDGIIVTSNINGFLPLQAIPAAPVGSIVTAVSGSAGAQTLTLSAPISQYFGNNPHATAAFTQTGTNNFANNDTIQVSTITYKFLTAITTASPAHSVLIGADFAASAANLVAAITGGNGEFKTYIPSLSGPDQNFGNLDVTASYASGVITFTTIYGGPIVNTYPSVYAGTGTAGTFGGATFAGANDQTTCASPCSAENGTVQTYQLPGPNSPNDQSFKIQTTTGSNSVTVIAGHRLLRPGDVIWSDAFMFGATVISTAAGSAIGNQTVTLDTPFVTGPANATVTHAPGSEGYMWIMPVELERNIAGQSSNNTGNGFPIGLKMSCVSVLVVNGVSGLGYNCTGSEDQNNWYQGALVGRWGAGNSISASGSINEKFANNYITDIFDGETLGMVYVNFNSNSPEGHNAKWSFIQSCGNTSVLLGGYIVATPTCAIAPQVNMYPPGMANGPLVIGPQVSNSGGTALKGNTIYAPAGLSVLSGNDIQGCVLLGGAPGGQLFGWSSSGCGTTSLWSVAINNTLNSFDLSTYQGGVPMRYVNSNMIGLAYPYYAGPTNAAIAFPSGVVVGGISNNQTTNDSRWFGMSNVKPVSTSHKKGDVEINTGANAGGPAGWFNTADGANFQPFGLIAQDAAGTTYLVGAKTAIASLPACAAGKAGFATVSNGQTIAAAGYGVAVSTTGSSIRAVFCDETGWTYH